MQYEPCLVKDGENPTVSWWVNFADSRLFVAYAGRLFAQDEMQVAEHPSLAHLSVYLRSNFTAYLDIRKSLMANLDPNEPPPEIRFSKILPFTRHGNDPTPILITGIERRCRVKTDANEAEGRPMGLYGNNFGRAEISVIEKATEVIHPPTISNLICMAALACGMGEYSKSQIFDLFTTSYTSFRAARIESIRMYNNGSLGSIKPNVIIHTGNWGTGAFGGSKPLMAIIQMAAALSADVDKLVYHSFNEEGTKGYNEGVELFKEVLKNPDLTLEMLLEHLEKKKVCVGNQ
jgi:hypothetical protein